jgi:hypothetical protein
MSTETRPDGSLWVQEFSLKDFAVAIQTNVQEGFVISLILQVLKLNFEITYYHRNTICQLV